MKGAKINSFPQVLTTSQVYHEVLLMEGNLVLKEYNINVMQDQL